MPSRRQLLGSLTAASAAGLAGCTDLMRVDPRDGEGDTIEIIVTNDQADPAMIGVRVEDEGGAALFSRVYRLGAGKADQSAGIDTTPAAVYVFTPTGTTATWAYRPDPDLDCDGQDIGITLTREGTLESWYGC